MEMFNNLFTKTAHPIRMENIAVLEFNAATVLNTLSCMNIITTGNMCLEVS